MSQKDIRSFFGGRAKPVQSPSDPSAGSAGSSSGSGRKSKRSARVIDSDDEDVAPSRAKRTAKTVEQCDSTAAEVGQGGGGAGSSAKKSTPLTAISAGNFFGSETPHRSFRKASDKSAKNDQRASGSDHKDDQQSNGAGGGSLASKLKQRCSENYGLAQQECEAGSADGGRSRTKPRGESRSVKSDEVIDLDDSAEVDTTKVSKRRSGEKTDKTHGKHAQSPIDKKSNGSKVVVSSADCGESKTDKSLKRKSDTSSNVKTKDQRSDENRNTSSTPSKKRAKSDAKVAAAHCDVAKTPEGKKVKSEKTTPGTVKATPTKTKATPAKAETTPTKIKATPAKAETTPKPDEATPTALDLQQRKAENYRRFLERKHAKPTNPGTLEVPEGSAGCLDGVTLVITGLLDNIGRDEAVELCKRLGARVTTAVSRNTSYLVMGQDPGASKTDKAHKLGTPTLDEAGLFQLIRSRTVAPSSPSATSTAATSAADCGTVDASTDIESDYVPNSQDTSATTLTAKQSQRRTHTGSVLTATPAVSSQECCSPVAASSLASLSQVSLTSDPASQLSSSSLTAAASAAMPTDNRLWVDKYRPTTLKSVIGQQGDRSVASKLRHWLRNWHRHNTGPGRIKVRALAAGYAADDGSSFKAALLSGPPGIGKSTIAALVCADLGYATIELNASDSRSKRLLEQYTDCLQSGTLGGVQRGRDSAGGGGGVGGSSGAPGMSAKHVLLMDEVDGMAGNEDRGGVAAVIQLLRQSRVPIICMCNDRQHQKIRSLAQYCFDLRVYRPRVEQIRAAMMSVCYKERLKVARDTIDQLIVGCNQDVRQVLHLLSMMSADRFLTASSSSHTTSSSTSTSSTSAAGGRAAKDPRLGVFDVVMKVFSATQRQGMSCDDKIRLFFNDYSLGPLFVHENYLSVVPSAAACVNADGGGRFNATGGRLSQCQLLRQLSCAADSLCDGDVTDRAIRERQSWSLLPVYAVHNTLAPGQLLAGHMSGRVDFPSWLGRNSSRNKSHRQLYELHVHTCLRTGGLTARQLVLEQLRPLRDHCLRPLLQLLQLDSATERAAVQTDGRLAAAVAAAAQRLFDYDLMREDVDQMNELCGWYDVSSAAASTSSSGGGGGGGAATQQDPLARMDSKWKAAFTRAVRNGQHNYPYSLTDLSAAVGKRGASASALLLTGEEGEEMGDDAGSDNDQSDQEDDNVTNDKMVKVKTARKKTDDSKRTAKAASGKEKSTRGRGKQKK